MHALKLAVIKSMRASDDEQGINKLRPKTDQINENILIYFSSFLDFFGEIDFF